MTSQVGFIREFHPGRICSLNCLTRVFQKAPFVHRRLSVRVFFQACFYICFLCLNRPVFFFSRTWSTAKGIGSKGLMRERRPEQLLRDISTISCRSESSNK